MNLWNQVTELLKTHTSIVVFVICACFATFSVGWTLAEEKYAEKGELEKKYTDLKAQITSVDRKVQSVESGLTGLQRQISIDSLVQQIASKDSDIFGLERLVENGEANNRDRERLAMLRSEQAELTRRLNALYAQ